MKSKIRQSSKIWDNALYLVGVQLIFLIIVMKILSNSIKKNQISLGSQFFQIAVFLLKYNL